MKKIKSLFDHLNQITKYKKDNYWNSLDEVDKKSWSTYMINRFLSMNMDWSSIINYIQKYNLNPKISYMLLNSLIPKSNIFLRYIKKNKSKEIKEDDLIKVSKYFECSKKESLDYIKILDNTQLKEIKQSFGVNK